MDYIDYEIKSTGTLKYDKVKSMSIFKKEINQYDYKYNYIEIKTIIDLILEGKFPEKFNWQVKKALDKIFNNIQYLEYDNNPYVEGHNFPDNWILPIG